MRLRTNWGLSVLSLVLRGGSPARTLYGDNRRSCGRASRPLPGPAFIEIPHDFFLAAVSADLSKPASKNSTSHPALPSQEVEDARRQIAGSRTPTILIGAGICDSAAAVRQLAELLQCPVFTTTSGKGMFPGDHPLSLGCISRLGSVQEVLAQSDLLISFGARLTEFDTGRFGLQLPSQHIQVIEDAHYAGDRIPSTRIVGEIVAVAKALAKALPHARLVRYRRNQGKRVATAGSARTG